MSSVRYILEVEWARGRQEFIDCWDAAELKRVLKTIDNFKHRPLNMSIYTEELFWSKTLNKWIEAGDLK